MRPKFARLSIDLTEDVLASGIVRLTARTRRFVERTFRLRTERHFAAQWMPREVLAVRKVPVAQGTSLTLRIPRGLAHVGDRVVLVAAVDPTEVVDALAGTDAVEGEAILLDGAALFVLHVFQKADPMTLARLGPLLLPNESAEVTTERDGKVWTTLRDQILTALVETEVRGLPSLQSLTGHLAERGIRLAFQTEDEEEVDCESLLRDLVEARKVQRRRRVPREHDEQRPPDIPRLLEGVAYEPRTASRPLLRLLEAAREAFGALAEHSEPEHAERLLRDVARSGASKGRDSLP